MSQGGIVESVVIIFGNGFNARLLIDYLLILGVKTDYVMIDDDSKRFTRSVTVPIVNEDIFKALLDKRVLLLFASKDKSKFLYFSGMADKYTNNLFVLDCTYFLDNNLYINPNYRSVGDKYCISCHYHIIDFLPGGNGCESLSMYHIIGGGKRNNVICPCCGSEDRERWFLYVLKHYYDLTGDNLKVLHFAPERGVKRYIKSFNNIDYYSGDIVRRKADNVIDIMNIHFVDNTFDYVFCNHVLEHIKSVDTAMNELLRVLKRGGKLFFSFPICTDKRTEDSYLESENERIEKYGQKDHMRLFGYDYREFFSKYRLKLKIYSPQEILSRTEIERYGFIHDDILIVGTNE